MNLVDRFRYVMKVYNETPSSFADKIGVQRSSISHILSERNKPSLDFIQKILEHYPKIDAQWLINGKQSPNETELVNEEQSESTPTEIQETKIEESENEVVENSNHNKQDERSKVLSVVGKKIDRIVVFYTDNTFESFNPEH